MMESDTRVLWGLAAVVLGILVACADNRAGRLNQPCDSTFAAFFHCDPGLECDALGDGLCKPADIFGTLGGPCAHAPGVLAGATCEGDLTCEMPGHNQPTRCANVVPVALTPDATGRIDGATNSVGVQGRWYPFGDAYGADGIAPGDCQSAGHATSDCSVVTTPTPGTGTFAPVAGTGLCTAGFAAKVINGSDGAPDAAHISGAGIALDLNNAGDTPLGKLPYDAPGNRVTGVAFDLDTDPPRPPDGSTTGRLNIEFPTTTAASDSPYWSSIDRGHNLIVWSQLEGPLDSATGRPAGAPAVFGPSQLLSIVFHVHGTAAGAIPFQFCINNLTALTE